MAVTSSQPGFALIIRCQLSEWLFQWNRNSGTAPAISHDFRIPQEEQRRFYLDYLQEFSEEDLIIFRSDAISIGDEDFQNKLTNVTGRRKIRRWKPPKDGGFNFGIDFGGDFPLSNISSFGVGGSMGRSYTSLMGDGTSAWSFNIEASLELKTPTFSGNARTSTPFLYGFAGYADPLNMSTWSFDN